MRKIFILTALTGLFLVTGCGRHYETVKGDPMGARIYTLDNGLKVYMSVNKEKPRIQTYIAVRVGGKNDPSETTGLAHYFEHLMFKGSESFGTSDYAAEKPMLDEIEQLFEQYRKTSDEAARTALYHRIDSVSQEASKLAIPNEYDKLMAMIGADGTNAWTSKDETVYTEDIPSNQIDNWARIQADRFRHSVIRGFHTELETIYEEKNMSMTRDSRKVMEALAAGLYPHHPYGTQTVLGTQDHLKNPSITNVKNYYATYYVPNNIAICASGDFDPDEMVDAIEKYFGDWKPNPEIPALKFDAETPITEPVVKEVRGLEAEQVALAWRIPGASDMKSSTIAAIAEAVLHNGQAGLIDLDIIQQQKALSMSAGTMIQPDYGGFYAFAVPGQGQTLDEVKDLVLGEIAKLRSGDFDESLISATINNIRLSKMQALESNSSRAGMFVDAFINGTDWKDAAGDIERYSSVTKADVVAWAEEFLKENSYVLVYKRQGEDKSLKKIAIPAITPIATNRDAKSAFLEEIAKVEVKPIEPVFLDFSKEMSQFKLKEGVNVLYKRNTTNDIFSLEFIYNSGSETDPDLSLASSYLSYLGTPTRSAEQIAARMYELACSFDISTGTNTTTISVSGLKENMEEAVEIVEDLIYNALPDDKILTKLKSDVLKSRTVMKANQRQCFNALTRYLTLGPETIAKITPSNDRILSCAGEDLLAKVRTLAGKGHEILYYGPAGESAVKKALAACHKTEENPEELPEKYTVYRQTPSSSVVIAPYNAQQLYYMQYSNRGEKFSLADEGAVKMYNEYFGGGMNSIVFQEMREARGLAYSAGAGLSIPSNLENGYTYMAFIATQNAKFRQAVEAFADIIDNMPESEAAFKIAQDGILSRLRTSRTVGMKVLTSYRACRRLGLDHPMGKEVFEYAGKCTLDDVKATQQKWASGRNYIYGILGDIKSLDTEFAATLGPVKEVTLEEIFGF